MKTLLIVLSSIVLIGCGSAINVGYLVDTGYAAGEIGKQYFQEDCKSGTIGATFDVDWNTGHMRYGGSIIVGCDQSGKLVRLKCMNDKGKTTCEELSWWYKEIK